MPVNLQKLVNSPFIVRFIAVLGRITPPGIGYRICDLLAGYMASRRDARLTRAIRTNQWVIRGTGLENEELDRAVHETLRNNARDIYTLHHTIHNPKRTRDLIVVPPAEQALLDQPEFSSRGLVIVGIHLSNFDLVLQSAFQQGFKAMVLTIPNPQGGRRVEFEMRKRSGMNVVPASVSAFRQAVKHLERGGIVLTGLDHPVPDAKQHPLFFGYPASLPVHHVSLARKADVPVVIMAAIQKADGKYHVMSSECIEMEHDADRYEEALKNAERVLKQAEAFIQMAPEQWNVPRPVWPELLDITPG